MKRFGFVVLHYLAEEMTVRCVKCLLALPGAAWKRIAVVDNASPNGSGEALRQRFADMPEVTVLSAPENLGFARGNNLGWRFLREDAPDFILVLNNDVLIEQEDFLPLVEEEYARRPFGVLGPDIVSARGGGHQSPSHLCIAGGGSLAAQRKELEGAVRCFPLYYLRKRLEARRKKLRVRARALARRILRRPPAGQAGRPARWAQETDNPVLHGACYVFGPEFIRLREDAFNPRTFLYFEEDILAYECLMSGMPMRYTPRLRVVHLEDVATDMAHRGAYAKERLKRQELYRSVGVLLDEQREDAARIRAEAAFRPAPGVSAEQTGMGYAGNAVNVAAFRHDPLVWRDSAAFAAYYGLDGHVRLSVRTGSIWRERDTGIAGSVRDAHNALSLSMDGAGVLHLAVSEHNGALRCFRGEAPGDAALVPEELPPELTRVTYPEFYPQPSGGLLLLARSGVSGNGRAVLCRLAPGESRWVCVQTALPDGGDERSPYWQACTDGRGRLHISYTWRETSDAASNRDLYYIVSLDETCRAFTWPQRVASVPAGSSLVNQTSMAADGADEPYILSLWRRDGILQYRLLWREGGLWREQELPLRRTDYVLSGRGTQAMPFGRPVLLARGRGGGVSLLLLLRDADRGNLPEALPLRRGPEGFVPGTSRLLSASPLGAWEPNADPVAWRNGTVAVLAQYARHVPDHRVALDFDMPVYALHFSTAQEGEHAL